MNWITLKYKLKYGVWKLQDFINKINKAKIIQNMHNKLAN